MNAVDFETADMKSVLQWLETASLDSLWDRFLTNQTNLFFKNEIELFGDQKWWIESHNILEIGSGNGEYLSKMAQAFPEKDYTGIELQEKPLAHAKARFNFDNLSFAQGNAEVFNPDFAGQFDVVVFRLTLQHLKAPKAALEYAYRYLKPQGYLLIIDSCDKAHKSSCSCHTLALAVQALNEKNSKGNRYITLEILNELLSEGPLSQQFQVETSNLTPKGLPKAGFKQMIFQGADRSLYFSHALLFFGIVKKEWDIPINLSTAYDELQVYLKDETSWICPGMHFLVLKKGGL
jgi:ubiquinone/menaquinone biosynthesis C-methylase UbiE